MSEKIELKVPATPAAEYVSQGNHSAKLTPKAVITVHGRRFADWLISEYGCTEIEAAEPEKDLPEGDVIEEKKTAGGKK